MAAVAALAVVATGCSGDDDSGAGPSERRLPADVTLAASLRRFDDCEGVRAWARDELAPRVGAYGWPGGGNFFVGFRGDAAVLEASRDPEDSDDLAVDSAAPQATGGDGGEPAFSTTNVQVEGVDEPDSVKTDGEKIVAVAQGSVHLVDPASQRVLDSVTLPDGMYDAQLLLAGERVLAFGNGSSGPRVTIEDDIGRPSPEIPGTRTRIVQLDIDGESLSISDSFLLDGTYVSARMTGDVARLVLHADPAGRLGFVTPAVPTEDAQTRATEANREAVEQAEATDFLPKWRELDDGGDIAHEGDLLACDDAHAPNTFSGFGMVTVVSIDISDGLRDGVTSANGAGVMAGGQTVYASAERLYVAAPEWQDWQTLDGDALRQAEERHGTDIHRFDITDPNQAEYEMSGHVDGDLLNQFAMDEFDGNLRVATTTGFPWSEGADTSESHVVVLAPGDGQLVEVGKVSGLGKGETIHAVRFIGAVGYVVTFRQTDPLYTIDLSDPTDPRVAGELKILGYSAYLHPIGDGRLIGVGQDADETGSTIGTQVALFDVRDPAAPTRVAQTTLPNGFSSAEWDHHAFLWWADTGLVAIPVETYDDQSSFQGVVGFTVDTEGATVTELGRIRHPGEEEVFLDSQPLPVEPGFEGDDVIAPDTSESSFVYTPPITRTLVIGDKVWTLSDSGLGNSDLATLGQTSFIPFG
ncbi:MAG: beta-propeller domain-containing protein [Actinomycetota bacterium]